MFHVPEEFRMPPPSPLGTTKEAGNNGVFLFVDDTPLSNIRRKQHVMRCIASDGGGWEHVSVSWQFRCPTWHEMCQVKEMFWDEEDCVVQFHPPASQYVNNHPFTLHLWRKLGSEFPTPPAVMV